MFQIILPNFHPLINPSNLHNQEEY